MEEFPTGNKLVPVYRREGDAILLVLRGDIDLHNSPQVRSVILDLLNKQKPKKLILNVGEVPYMDSSAIAVLVEGMQKLKKDGGKIYLTNLQPRVRGLLEIARLDTIFALVGDEQEALKK